METWVQTFPDCKNNSELVEHKWMWFYLSVLLHFPRRVWDVGSLLKFPVVRIKEIVAALLRASDTFLIRSQPLTLGCTDRPSFYPFGIDFLRVAVGSNHTDEVASYTVHSWRWKQRGFWVMSSDYLGRVTWTCPEDVPQRRRATFFCW